jgi:hypothetical protein
MPESHDCLHKTSGLGSPCPHSRTRTGLTPPTSALGLGQVRHAATADSANAENIGAVVDAVELGYAPLLCADGLKWEIV